jgi:hypothetical protein
VAGAQGVEDVLRLLGQELTTALALCGCPSAARADGTLVGGFR